jgi:hypothetical protein
MVHMFSLPGKSTNWVDCLFGFCLLRTVLSLFSVEIPLWEEAPPPSDDSSNDISTVVSKSVTRVPSPTTAIRIDATVTALGDKAGFSEEKSRIGPTRKMRSTTNSTHPIVNCG